jgi:hypothetical protein
MKEEKSGTNSKRFGVRTAKECAYLALFVALVIAVQLAFSGVPGVEGVTLLFVVYAFVFGVYRGMLAATIFSLLRQFLFGFSPTVLLLYLIYYNGLAAVFGGLGKVVKKPLRALWWLTILACVCTACFTMLDNVITPLFYGYSWRATQVYFYASLIVMLPQIVCTAVSVGTLFVPLQKVFRVAKRGLL